MLLRGENKVVVARHQIGHNERQVVTPHLAEIIRAAVDLGASYPDIAQMLIQAERQHNLPGRLGIDKLPEAGRYYNRAGIALAKEEKKSKRSKIGRVNLSPNLFPAQAGPKDSRKSGFNSINVQESDEEDDVPEFGSFQGSGSGSDGLMDLSSDMKMNSLKEKQIKKDEKSSNPLNRLRALFLKQTTNSFLYTDPKDEEE